jgi:hypothetical protein
MSTGEGDVLKVTSQATPPANSGWRYLTVTQGVTQGDTQGLVCQCQANQHELGPSLHTLVAWRDTRTLSTAFSCALRNPHPSCWSFLQWFKHRTENSQENRDCCDFFFSHVNLVFFSFKPQLNKDSSQADKTNQNQRKYIHGTNHFTVWTNFPTLPWRLGSSIWGHLFS